MALQDDVLGLRGTAVDLGVRQTLAPAVLGERGLELLALDGLLQCRGRVPYGALRVQQCVLHGRARGPRMCCGLTRLPESSIVGVGGGGRLQRERLGVGGRGHEVAVHCFDVRC